MSCEQGGSIEYLTSPQALRGCARYSHAQRTPGKAVAPAVSGEHTYIIYLYIHIYE